MQSFPITAGKYDTAMPVSKGDVIELVFQEDVTDYQVNLGSAVASAVMGPPFLCAASPTSSPVACPKGTSVLLTASGLSGPVVVTYDNGGKSYTLTINTVTVPAGPSPCAAGQMVNPGWLVAKALGGNTTGVPQCVPLGKTAAPPVSSASTVAIAASVAVVAAVGIGFAASRGAFTRVAAEARENLRRSRV